MIMRKEDQIQIDKTNILLHNKSLEIKNQTLKNEMGFKRQGYNNNHNSTDLMALLK